MGKVTVSPKFQVVIPKEVREQIGVKVGMKLEIITFGNRMELIPIEPIKKLRGSLSGINSKIDREGDRF
ncbi:transcriptional regulator, AbrB family [Leptospira yanagawae serovar Saopaulo str. Sao Paulo = ATCC 700523]|uniref:AbrB/MazE/SpoVT family DNA-binding domain-containing protein n=2 Tax=Leptospira TaxID=171 RepID=A0A7I0HWC8_9LEPT|nr:MULTISPECIES: AbrB/MazE/SpoVT family DNA-binding domain-containing protein [Leptospira]EOQ88808.1 transcriptional regulator, AbrB family [Leptospira yanagawae serovar Saopaulo str. Sao Paulo = ATCC 700523]TGK53023.1 AbrB/MazE/SpoVT family DNA-binding domain-containing protein [Leptospira bouyouniensis]TGL08342.1 AbrB/MazE/SpoVT family DNA-binding domain-containing protein [Leptospira bouyouniensis]TGM87240.1 AbrB/MazE/SpoVT family DNA-binding domain-containing protein [Leptospira bouyouniens